ncbi:MAG TPA: hypothetical protein VFQ61_06555 [Polyangiaceae bacterium]|nr:hypothetical protein [Polyangiaceae bacterium]
MAFVDVVLGIDLSLTGLGLVAVPADWDLLWSRVHRISLGVKLCDDASPRDHVMRRRALCDDVVRWASRRHVTHAWVEGYPIGRRNLFNLHKQAELRGVLEDRLAELGLYLNPVAEATARKLLLGKLPPTARKEAVFSALDCVGAGFTDRDQADAFTVANYGLKELGAPWVSYGAPEAPQKRARKKRAA